MKKLLAFDFGASSGRAILGEYENGALTYREIHRFENNPVEENGHLRWNFPELMREVYRALEMAGPVDSIAFDTWGVDFGLLDENGNLLEKPVHYRDSRTQHTLEKAFSVMSAQDLYAATGSQLMAINTLFQLMETDLSKAKQVLFMPDLFAYQLCKKAVCEQSIASTSQMLDLQKKAWSETVLSAFEIPKEIFAPLVQSGTVIGEYQGAKVVAVAGHDTQSAVAAMPAQNENSAFLSCGTWSLFGCELDATVLTAQSREAEMSNELGANGKINYLKNITGLWLIQESRRQWRREGKEYSFGEIAAMAEQAEPMKCFIDVNAPQFAAPGDVPERIREYCRETGQFVPQSVGEVARCIYESLAWQYRETFLEMQNITGKRFETLHILGGGCQAALLCQLTADALGVPVQAGPVEATALGNLLLQLKALGEIDSLAEGRAMIQKIETVTQYLPSNSERWASAGRFFRKGEST